MGMTQKEKEILAKIHEVEEEMKQRKEESKKRAQEKAKAKATKKKAPTVRQKYTKIKEELKSKEKPQENAFSDNYEHELIKTLFKDDKVEETKDEPKEEVKVETPRERSGTWDYVLEDEIKFFDPECSYELTGYKPITEEKGLDFNPEWFTEAARTYEETGNYTEYPAGTKMYADYWMTQLDRCTNGYTVNGYRLTGDNYFFLNFYRMNIVDEGKKAASGDTEGFPKFVAEQYKFFHYFEMCEYLKKDVVALKSRGIEFCATI